MPRYRYVCETCAESFEVFQKISDEPLSICPSCGGKLKKTIANVGVVFKGSGFYSTDSKTGSRKSKKAESPND